jgi:hypothetical protein
VAGPPPTINFFHNLGVKSGGPLCGLYSAQYSFSRSIKSIYSPGNSNPIAKYAELPNIEMSYSQYMDSAGSPSPSEFNSISKIELQNRSGSVICDLALLSKLVYSFTIDGPFLVTKTYQGYGKPAGGGAASICSGTPRIFKRQDYSGGSPPGIGSSVLVGVTAEITVNRQTVPEFATRRPYASFVSYPMTSSIKYDLYTESVDSYILDAFAQACGDPNSTTYSLSAGACGVSVSISKAYVTDLSYSGGDAVKGSSPQTVSVTFTSYETLPGLRSVIKFDELK